MKAFVVVLTLNAAGEWPRFVTPLLASVSPGDILIVDSSSTDGTAALAIAAGFRVHTIQRSEFNHGGTRQLAAEMLAEADILVYMTQDAILAGPDSLRLLLASFDDPNIAIAYGRQLPKPGARAIEAHARLFNYPDRSMTRDLESRKQLGFKAIFVSNSFAAYRRSALLDVGGFPSEVIFGEDTVTAARLLMAGWKIRYVGDATVFHSHSYTLMQDFRRYFDIGVLHRREGWLLEEFGGASGEGGRFVRSELRYLLPRARWSIPSALMRTVYKLTGYRLGRMEDRLSVGLKRRLSMHTGFWR